LLEYEFELVVEGKLTGMFQSLGGGAISIAQIKHDVVFETGLSTTLVIPGATSFGAFKLSRGYANYAELYLWLMEASNGRIIQARRDGSIKMVRRGYPLLQWDFFNAWPIELTSFGYNQFTGKSSARVAIKIQAESIEYVPVTPPDPEADDPSYFANKFAFSGPSP
jgi:phage tail-like protein